jgi:hypothetical protein
MFFKSKKYSPIKSNIFFAFLFFCIAIQNQVHAKKIQRRDSLTAIYMSIGQHWYENDQGVPFNISFLINNHIGGSFSSKKFIFKSPEYPFDYRVGFFQKHYCCDVYRTNSFLFNFTFPHKSKLLRLGIECGPSIVDANVLHFTPNPAYNPVGWFGVYNNYNVSIKTYQVFGVENKFKVDFPILRYVGIECSIYANWNKIKNLYGGEINLSVGILRGKVH